MHICIAATSVHAENHLDTNRDLRKAASAVHSSPKFSPTLSLFKLIKFIYFIYCSPFIYLYICLAGAHADASVTLVRCSTEPAQEYFLHTHCTFTIYFLLRWSPRLTQQTPALASCGARWRCRSRRPKGKAINGRRASSRAKVGVRGVCEEA